MIRNRNHGPTWLAGLILLLALGAQDLQAQSIFGAAGLGLRVDALDARLVAMGSVGPGAPGNSLPPGSPASAAGLRLPTITATMQPSWGSFEDGAGGGDVQGVRFPVLAIGYPTSFAVVTASYGSFLDQRWAARRVTGFQIGGETLEATDRFESRGGISTFRIGLAREVGERAAVGISVGRHTGKVSRAFGRSFDSLAVGSDVASFADVAEWGYSGTVITLGARLDPNPVFRVGAALTWNGTLTAESRDELTPRGDAEFNLPVELRVGASARLTPALSLNVGVTMADWTDSDGGLEEITTRGRTLAFSGGVESTGVTFAGRTLPLRLGFRRSELPYQANGVDAVEQAVTAGLGLRLAELDEVILAGLDVALERGSRSAGIIDESFWRMTLSLRVSGG